MFFVLGAARIFFRWHGDEKCPLNLHKCIFDIRPINYKNPPLIKIWYSIRGGGSYKFPKTPKFSAPAAPILTYLYRIYASKTSFLRFLAPQAKILSICTSFLSDFSVKNDDFQRES